MMKRLTMGLVAAAAVGAGLVTPTAAADTTPDVPAGYLEALQRDLGLTAEEAERRVVQEDAAMRLQATLLPQLGKSFAGSWFDAETGGLTVAVTDRSAVAEARQAGANVAVMSRDLADLDKIKSEFDALGAAAGIVATRVDPKANAVVVTTAGPATSAVTVIAARHSGAIRTEQTPTPARPLKEWLEGGEMAGTVHHGNCSIGFAAFDRSRRELMITAGHCGEAGSPVKGWNGTQIGVFELVRWRDGNDYATTTTDPTNWLVDGIVSTDGPSGDTALLVRGSAEAPVGASVCKSGITTGWTCGEILAKNETITDVFSGIHVDNLTKISACGMPGDSGGSVMSGTQAQGVISMGPVWPDRCKGPMWFQPLGEILTNEGLTLMPAQWG